MWESKPEEASSLSFALVSPGNQCNQIAADSSD